MEIVREVNNHFKEFLLDNSQHIYFLLGGYGSSKSFNAAVKLVLLSLQEKRKILVVNTHLDNKMDNKHEELDDLFSVINKFRGDVKFLCGDFNLLPTTEHYGKIRETWNDSYFEGKDLHGNKNEATRDLETARIDYIMARKDANYKVKESFYINDNSRDWTKLSDHLPYMAVFDVK